MRETGSDRAVSRSDGSAARQTRLFPAANCAGGLSSSGEPNVKRVVFVAIKVERDARSQKHESLSGMLCGGSGTRLGPMACGGYPRQVLKLIRDKMQVQQTALRLCGIADAEAPIVVTGSERRFLVAEQLRQSRVRSSWVVLEPIGRNTAQAIAVAAQASPAHSCWSCRPIRPSSTRQPSLKPCGPRQEQLRTTPRHVRRGPNRAAYKLRLHS